MNIKNLFKNTLKYIRGSFYVNRMVHPNGTVYVLNNQHIGDVCYALAFVETYQKMNNIGDIKVLWSGKFREVYEAFSGFELYPMAEEKQTDILCYLMKSKKGRKLVDSKKFIVTYTSYHMSSEQMEEQKITVPELLATKAFGLDAGVQLKMPIVQKKDISEIVEKYHIKKNQSVILNPYALSMELPLEIFEFLSTELSKRGYVVITNLKNRDAKPLSNSVGIWLSLSEMYNLAEYCGCVIGVRSGFFDFLVSAKCNFFVFYDMEYDMKTAYSLDAWSTKNTIREYVVDSKDWQNSVNEAIDNFEKQMQIQQGKEDLS